MLERLSEELIRVSPHTLSQRPLKMKDQINGLGLSLTPVLIWDKCSEKAYAVNGAPLQIPHMVWNVHVCRNRVCQNFHLVLLNFGITSTTVSSEPHSSLL